VARGVGVENEADFVIVTEVTCPAGG